MLELGGVRDVLAKSLGTTNPINMLKAAETALRALRRPADVARARDKAIVDVLPFTLTDVPLRACIHVASQIGEEVPVWDIRDRFGDTGLLVANVEQGRDLAKTMGKNYAALMRGHGNAVVAPRLRVLVGRAIYTEENARLQLQAMSLGKVNYLAPGEVEKMESLVGNSGQDRIWDMWKAKAEQNPTIRKP